MNKCVYCDKNIKSTSLWCTEKCRLAHKSKSKCAVCKNKNVFSFNKKYENFFCFKHICVIYNKKNPFKRSRNTKNDFIKRTNYAEMKIYNNKSIFIASTKVSLSDVKNISNYSWCLVGDYVGGTVDGKIIYLHQFILGKKQGFVIDHINEDKLDNRRNNLQFLTNKQNICKSLSCK